MKKRTAVLVVVGVMLGSVLFAKGEFKDKKLAQNKWIQKCTPYAFDYYSPYSIDSRRRKLTKSMVYCRCLFKIFELNKSVDSNGNVPWSIQDISDLINVNLDAEEYCGKFR